MCTGGERPDICPTDRQELHVGGRARDGHGACSGGAKKRSRRGTQKAETGSNEVKSAASENWGAKLL